MEKLKQPGNEEKLLKRKEELKETSKNYLKNVYSDIEKAEQYRSRKAKNMRDMRMRNKMTKDQVDSDDKSSYSRSSLSKAVSRVEGALPKLEEKKKIVIQKLAIRHNVFPSPSFSPKKKRPRVGFADIEKAVLEFYESDIIARMNPGIKDFIKKKDINGNVEMIQTFTLTMTLEEAHKKFIEFHPQHPVGFTKFSTLRPQHVKLYSHVKHKTCLCSYCENIDLMASSFLPYLQEKCSVRKFLENLCCDYSIYDCVNGECNDCNDVAARIESLLIANTGENVTSFLCWEKNGNFFEQMRSPDITINELILKFVTEFTSYKLHYYIQKEQKAILNELKEALSETEAIIVCDFAERFTTRARREIQSAFFGKRQISLFTAMLYMGTKKYSFIIVSDENSQSKFVVFAYISRIIEIAKEEFPNLSHLRIFSDGCAGQFKNKFGISNLNFAPTDWGLNAEWNFFATGHGKSPCDGLGGSVKRSVHRKVIAGDFRVYSAAEFVACASTCGNKMTIFEMTATEIEEKSNFLKGRWIKVPALNGIQKHHHFRPSSTAGKIIGSITTRGIGEKEF